MKSRHLGVEHYLLLARGKMTAGEFLARLHRQLVEECEECREEFEELVGGQRTDLDEIFASVTEPIPFDPTPPPERVAAKPSPYATAFSRQAELVAQEERRLRREKRQALRELEELLAIPAPEREHRISRARSAKFRSPALAHLLVREARERVRRSTDEATELLDLAHKVVVWSTDGPRSNWGRSLLLRIEAHRANACRVAGELPEADRRFRALRHRLAVDDVADGSLDAEVASLEASLRWDQARPAEAMELLDQARRIYREVGEVESLARVLVKRAAIAHELERPSEALSDLEQARQLLDPEEDSFLYLCVVAGAAPILIDLDRSDEALAVIDAAAALVGPRGELWWERRFQHLRGRALLAGGDAAGAESLLVEAREGFATQGLPQDTANASLDLALVYLHQGRTGEARRLCETIAPIFEALRVPRSGLATLKLLAEAKVADAAALAWVAELRRHVAGARRPAPKPS